MSSRRGLPPAVFFIWRRSQVVKTPPFHGGSAGSSPAGVTSSQEVKVSMYEFRYVKDHVEVYYNGEFCFSADTMQEARAELAEIQR